MFQIDDAEDVQVLSSMLDPPLPDGFYICNTNRVPGVPNIASDLQVQWNFALWPSQN